jgi:hypothetical protein
MVRVLVAKTFYEKAGEPFPFVRVRVVNETDAALAVDLRRHLDVFYPRRVSPPVPLATTDDGSFHWHSLSEAERFRALTGFYRGSLTTIPPHGFTDYYRAVDGLSRAKIVSQSHGKALEELAMDGLLDVTDGTEVERVAADAAVSTTRLDLPLRWERVPDGAKIVDWNLEDGPAPQ